MSDLIDRQAAINAVDSETVITNPEHFKSNEKFIKFMDDSDISSFGKWQWANGFNTALVATRIHLKNLPSAEKAQLSGEDATFDCISRQGAIDVEGLDEQIRCEMCRNPMHTNRGCDGNCQYDERLYERIMQILSERIKPSPSAEPRKKGTYTESEQNEEWYCLCAICNECGSEWMGSRNFCPNCGCQMNGGEEK